MVKSFVNKKLKNYFVDTKNSEKKVIELKNFIENDLESKMSKEDVYNVFSKAWRSLFFCIYILKTQLKYFGIQIKVMCKDN